MGDEQVLMQHNETGGTAYFAPAAVDMWRPKGWAPVAELEALAESVSSEAEQAGEPGQQAIKPPRKASTDKENA